MSALAGTVTVLLHCRKSLFLNRLRKRADNVAGDGDCDTTEVCRALNVLAGRVDAKALFTQATVCIGIRINSGVC